MKLTPIETVAVWNKLVWTNPSIFDGSPPSQDLHNDPAWTGWIKRFATYAQPEIKMWNSMSGEEREEVKKQTLSFPVDKLDAKHLPDFLSEEDAEILKPVVKGKIKVREPQLKKP